MFLTARQNGFYFNFPKGYFSESLQEKYTAYVKRLPIPYDTIGDFMNATIQSVTFPTLSSIDHVEQTRPGGYRQIHKSSTHIQNLVTRDFNITFKLVEGYMNYWIMYEAMVNALDFSNTEAYLPDLTLRLLDADGIALASVFFQRPIYKSLTEIQLNYANTSPAFTTFSVGMKCNYINIKLEVG